MNFFYIKHLFYLILYWLLKRVLYNSKSSKSNKLANFFKKKKRLLELINSFLK